jgi:hypothetical protein
MNRAFWTEEEVLLLRAHYPHRRENELRALLPGRTRRGIFHKANKLGLRKTPEMILALKKMAAEMARIGFLSRYSRGSIPWNKGQRHMPTGNEGHRFAVGNLPHTSLPLGAERWRKGFLYRKVSEARYGTARRRWKRVHHILWEEANGPIPPGHVVHFIDGDSTNLAFSNLACVHRGVLAWIARNYPEKPADPEISRTLIALAELELSANKAAGGSRVRGRMKRLMQPAGAATT